VNRAELLTVLVPYVDAGEQAALGALAQALRAAAAEAIAYGMRLRGLRSAIAAGVLSGDHEIPEAYDRLLTEDAA